MDNHQPILTMDNQPLYHTFETIINDIKKEIDDKFWELDDIDYYLEDRSRWMSNLIQKLGLDEQDYDTDIHSLCWKIFQMMYFGKIIYEDDKGNIINYDTDSVVSNQQKVIKENIDEEMGKIGMIFLRFCYDNLPQKRKIELLNTFRNIIRDKLKDERQEVLDFPKLKKDNLERELSDDNISKNHKVSVVDSFVESSNFDIENYLKKIGFTDLQMIDFFKNVIDDNVTT